MKQWGDYETSAGYQEGSTWQPPWTGSAADHERLGYGQQPEPQAPSRQPGAATGEPGYGPLPVLLQPGPGPRRAPAKSWVARHKAFTAVATVGGVICVAAVASAAQSPVTAARPAAAAPAVPVSCAAQVRAWVTGGAVQRMSSFSGDLGSFTTAAQAFAGDVSGGGASAGDVPGVRSAAAAIQSDAQGVEASPGPACIPGLRVNLAAAAGDYANAAADADHGVSQYTGGNLNDAASDFGAASAAIKGGNAKLALATAAVSTYESGPGG